MKVLLISANKETAPYPVYPLGLDYVAGAIKDKHRVRIADMNPLKTADALVEDLGTFAPDMIGISIRNVDNTDVCDPKSFTADYQALIRHIRQHTSAPIVLGGSGFNIFPREMLEHLGADYGIIGEGERFAQFVEAWQENRDCRQVPGVIKRGCQPGNGMPPPWQGRLKRHFTPDMPHVTHYLDHGGMLNLQTKRGCHFNCIYCTYPLIEGRRLRLIPPAEAAETAYRLQAAGARYLFITDSTFNADPEHSMAVARAFKTIGIRIPWGAYIAPARMPADYFSVMADAGMTHIEFGTDAFSDPILENYQKPFRAADIFDAHQKALDAGIYTAHFFLLGAPAETRQTLMETLENAASLKRTVCFFFSGIRIYPDTPIHEMARAAGKLPAGQDLMTPCFYSPEGISLSEIEQIAADWANPRINWVFGSGGDATAEIIHRLHARGKSGPLWEYLIR